MLTFDGNCFELIPLYFYFDLFISNKLLGLSQLHDLGRTQSLQSNFNFLFIHCQFLSQFSSFRFGYFIQELFVVSQSISCVSSHPMNFHYKLNLSHHRVPFSQLLATQIIIINLLPLIQFFKHMTSFNLINIRKSKVLFNLFTLQAILKLSSFYFLAKNLIYFEFNRFQS